MASLLEDLVQYIILNNLATESGKDIFQDYDPDEPSQAIIMIEYDSKVSSSVSANAGVRYVQFSCRDLQPTPAKNSAWALYRLFIRPDSNVTNLPGGRWCIMSPKDMPKKIRVDEKKRIIYGFNIAITTNFD